MSEMEVFPVISYSQQYSEQFSPIEDKMLGLADPSVGIALDYGHIQYPTQ